MCPLLVLAAALAADAGTGGGAGSAVPTLTRAPQVVTAVQAEYPEAALAQRAQGDVQLAVDLAADGRIDRAEVLLSPSPLLADAAIRALLQMRFTAAEVDHVPTAVRIRYSFHFALPEAPPAAERAPRLTGQLCDETGAPVAQATLRLRPSTLLARTDAEGRFTMTLPAAGSYSLAVSGATIEASEAALTAHADETLTLHITVKRAQAGGGYATAVRGKLPKYDISRTQLTRDELRAVPGAFGDPLRVLEALPGLGRAPFASGILVMRGGSPDDSEVFLDGHPMPLLYHFGGGPSVVPPEAIGTIDLEPGGFPVRYGRATAGIVEVETRPGHTERLHAGAHVSVLDAGATLDGPLGPAGSFRLAARRSYIDVVLPWASRIIGGNSSLSLAPRYYDYLARFDIDLPRDIKLSLTGHGSDDLLDFAQSQPPIGLPAAFALHTASQRINPRLTAALAHGVTLLVSPIISWLTDHGQTPYDFSSLDTLALGLRAEAAGRPHPALRLSAGLDAMHQDHRFAAQVAVPLALDRDFPSPTPTPTLQRTVPGRLRVLQVGAFADASWQLGALRLLPGVRAEHAAYLGHAETTAEPRLSARLGVQDAVTLKAALGLYHRLPLPDQISDVTGNPDLGYERSLQDTLGIEWAIDQAHSLDVQIYSKWMDQLTYTAGGQRATPAGPVPRRYANSGQGRTAGLEVLLRRRLYQGVMGWVSYSLSRSERRATASARWDLYGRDQTHNLNVLLAVELPWRLHVGGRARYVSGYPVRPVNGAVFDADSGSYLPLSGATLSDRLPAFAQLDLRVDREFGRSEGFNMLVFIDIQNVTNRQNAEYYTYSQDYSERYAYAGLPFLPSVGIEARY